VARRESIEQRKKRVRRLLRRLRRLYPEADCALTHRSAWQLLVATILSAQSTDETVNRVTPILFARYPKPADLAAADVDDVQEIIHATGFFRQKTRSIMGAARMVVDDYRGKVPDEMADLLKLPGVARKTANVVLGTWFQKNEGIVVDTHVGRLADRLRLVWNHKNPKDAVKIETDLMRITARKDWTYLSHALIWHGRRVCMARKPDCAHCTLADECPSADL